MVPKYRLLVLAVFIACLSPMCSAQVSEDQAQGLKPYGSYDFANFDAISMTGGQLVATISLPPAVFPQRAGKLRLNFVFTYNNNSYNVVKSCSPAPPYTCTYSVQSAVTEAFIFRDDQQLTSGSLAAIKISNGEFLYRPGVKTPDGSTHLMGLISGTAINGTFRTIDATGIYLASDGSFVDRDGIRYYSNAAPSTLREDTNGNQITVTSTGWIDTLGRSIPQPVSTSDFTGCTGQLPIASAKSWTIPAPAGGTVTLKLCYANVSIQTNFNGGGGSLQYTATRRNLQSIVLPNGKTWAFEYNSRAPSDPSNINYGDLSKVTLPTGGIVSYTWSSPGSSGNGYGRRFVVTRTVDAQDGTSPHTWSYSGVAAPAGNFGFTMTVTDALGNDTVHTSNCCVSGTSDAPTYFETQVDFYQGTGGARTLLKTVKTDYSYSANPYSGYDPGSVGPMNVVPVRTTTIWPNGQTSKTEVDYDSGFLFELPEWSTPSTTQYTAIYGNPIAKREYDYGSQSPGPLLRQTKTTYMALGGPNASSYLANNLLSIPYAVQVLDGSGNQKAYTFYGYDEYALANVGAVSTQHDSAPPAGTARGNLTSDHRWLNGSTTATSNCPISVSNGYVVNYSVHNDTGTLDHFVDACGSSASDTNHKTSYTYSLNYAGAYPTAITNARNQTGSHTYDFNTGLITSTTDPNSKTTAYTYNDSLARLTEVDYPDGGVAKNFYTDTPLAVTVETQRKIDSSRWTDSFARYDGLARPVVQSVANDETTPWDRTDNCYDALRRVQFISYPYQGSNATSAPNCSGVGDSFMYDPLGRVTQVTHSDGTTVSTAYTGRATQTQDEGNGTHRITRISQIDGLGQLVSVCEVTPASQIGSNGTPAACGQDISGTGFLTAYGYDTLANLTSASQGGVNPRMFQYDSLSRLISASNPESGTISYGYDANGNLIARRDARSITTTYSYDTLNRLAGKSYSDGTPAATFNYDQTSALGVTLTNTIGRESSEGTGGSSPSGSVFSYDSMGRVANNSQCTPQNCGTGVFVIQYAQYDFLGDLISGTNAAGVTFTYSYNRTARLASIATNFVDSSHPGTLFSNAHYAASGGLTSSTLGNTLSESLSYDTRLRKKSYAAASGATTLYSFNITSFAPDGDVLAANDSVNGNWTYSYDDFNRLSGSNQNSGQAVYSYVYDRFGNRWQQNGPHSMQLSFSGANNRMDGYSYDAAGNLLNDGSHSYFYDAENRVIQVDGTLGNCSTATACYTYDAEGRRVRKATASGTFDFLYDAQGHKVAEVDTTGTFQRGELYSGNRHIAVYAPDPGPTGATFFIHADWVGTERARTNMSGTACETITSLAFGDGQTISDSCGDSAGDVSPLHFTGKERDSESGLDNFGARYDSSQFGRFMSPDPMLNSGRPWDPRTWNRYAYARNNPLNIIDPNGLYDLVNSCKSGDEKCNKQFRKHADDLKKGLSELQKKVNKMKDGPEKQRLQAALTAFGTEGDHNGVEATFGKTEYGGAAETKFRSNDIGQIFATVTFDPEQTIGSDSYAINAAHEGTHVEDSLTEAVNDYIAHGSLVHLSDFSYEYRGYQTSAYAASALGEDHLSFGGGQYQIWNHSWATVDDAAITRLVTERYKHPDGTPYEETKPHNPWSN